MHSRTIRIGLNLIALLFLTGCDLFNWDASPVKYSDRYTNLSSQDVSLVFDSMVEDVDVYSLSPGAFIDRVRVTWNDDNTIEQFITDMFGSNPTDISIYLILDSDTLKNWTGPSDFMGENVNTPFNYDAWKIDDNSKVVQFTIMESDLTE